MENYNALILFQQESLTESKEDKEGTLGITLKIEGSPGDVIGLLVHALKNRPDFGQMLAIAMEEVIKETKK